MIHIYDQLLFGEWKIFFLKKIVLEKLDIGIGKKIKLIPLSFYKNKLRWTIAVRNKDFEVSKIFWIEHKEQYPQKDRLINLTLS